MGQVRIVSTETAPAELIAFRISAKQRQQLKKVAAKRQQSVSETVRQMIAAQLP